MSSNRAFDLEHEITASFKGIDFPAGREAIVQKAEQNGASAEVLDVLKRLRGGEFDNAAQVMDATNEQG